MSSDGNATQRPAQTHAASALRVIDVPIDAHLLSVRPCAGDSADGLPARLAPLKDLRR